MPASICDPVTSALRLSLTTDESQSSSLLDSRLYSSAKSVLLSKIEFEESGDYQSNVLDGLKSKYVVIRPKKSVNETKFIRKECSLTSQTSAETNKKAEEGLPKPKKVLFPLEKVQLGWQHSWEVGSGMQNMGNTCYLNSTLQALFHIPAFANWLISEQPHAAKCNQQEACVICGMRTTLLATQKISGTSIKPWQVYSKLRLICRHLTPGRQEDAHEFLKYAIEALEKCYLSRFVNYEKMEQKTKETTPLGQIFGGYLRSTVRCLACHHLSTTFQHFEDLLLDVRTHNTVDDALEYFFSRERLEDLGYRCEKCHKKVSATKQFFLEQAPQVLCIALKRFSYGAKLSKPVHFKKILDVTRYLYNKNNQQLTYKLVSLVTHYGPSQNSGHYTAIGQARNENFYMFDDDCVRPISLPAVLGTNAYIMFFEKKNVPEKVSTPTTSTSSVVYGPQLPTNILKEDKKPIILNSTSVITAKSDVNLSFRDQTDLRSFTGTKSLEKMASTSKLVKTPKSPLEKLEEQMNKNESSAETSRNCSTGSRLVPYDSESSCDERNDAHDEGRRPKPSRCKSPRGLVVTTKSMHHAWTVSSEKNGPLLSPSLNGVTNKKVKEKEERRENDQSPNTSVSSMSPLSDRSGAGTAPAVPATVLEAQTHVPAPVSVHVPAPALAVASAPTLAVASAPALAVASAPALAVASAPALAVASAPALTVASTPAHAPAASSLDTLRHLQGVSHRGYGAPVHSWNGTHSALSRQVFEERREERKRTFDATDEMDRGRNKKVKKFHHCNRFNSSRNGYNPFQERQDKPHWGNNFKYRNERRPPHHFNKHNSNKYKRFNRYSNNGHHYPRHH